MAAGGPQDGFQGQNPGQKPETMWHMALNAEVKNQPQGCGCGKWVLCRDVESSARLARQERRNRCRQIYAAKKTDGRRKMGFKKLKFKSA